MNAKYLLYILRLLKYRIRVGKLDEQLYAKSSLVPFRKQRKRKAKTKKTKP
jgi:hypothetical protein